MSDRFCVKARFQIFCFCTRARACVCESACTNVSTRLRAATRYPGPSASACFCVAGRLCLREVYYWLLVCWRHTRACPTRMTLCASGRQCACLCTRLYLKHTVINCASMRYPLRGGTPDASTSQPVLYLYLYLVARYWGAFVTFLCVCTLCVPAVCLFGASLAIIE